MIETDRTPELRCRYFTEPLLRFAAGKEHVDPKTGLARWGPLSLDPLKRHPDRVRVGFVGTSDTIEKAEKWIKDLYSGVHVEIIKNDPQPPPAPSEPKK